MPASENVKQEGRHVALGKWSKKHPKLVERAKEWGFDLPTDAPFGDRVIVWRLPPLNKAGSLYVPEDAQSPHVLGVLVAAGMKALDMLESQGITLGHMVKFERFAGWEHDDVTPEHKRGARFLHLNDRNILTSVDLMEDLEAGRVRYIRGDDGKSRLEMNLISDKKAKVLRLAADPSATPAERRTAKRLANKLK